MNTKPRTTYKCRWVPRRTVARTFKASDVARVYCKALSQGETRAEIQRQLELKCPDPETRQPDNRQILEQAQALSISNLTVLNDTYQLFFTVNAVMLALLALPAIIRRSPGLFVIFRGLARLQSSVAAQVTVIGRQVAANESFYTTVTVALRRAA